MSLRPWVGVPGTRYFGDEVAGGVAPREDETLDVSDESFSEAFTALLDRLKVPDDYLAPRRERGI